MNHYDECHNCPICGQRAAHRVVRERVVATVMWCQRCFTPWIADEKARAAATPPERTRVA